MALVLTVTQSPAGVHLAELRKVFGPEGGTLGRAPDSSWYLPDPRRLVSSCHATVRCIGESYFLVDNSTNGVFLNGASRPLGDGNQVRLTQGDRLKMGDYEVIVESVIPVIRAVQVSVPDAQWGQPDNRPPDHKEAGHKQAGQQQPDHGHRPAITDASLDALLEQLGIDVASLTIEARVRVVPMLAEWIQEATSGLMKSLVARSALRNEFRIHQTAVQALDNNPIKFAPTVDEALRIMFNLRSSAYMPGPLAVRRSFQDLSMHEMAMITGMRAAFEHMMTRFSPDTLRDRFDKVGGKAGVLQSRKAHYWECYEAHFEELAGDRDAAFRELFGEEFAEAYEQYILAAEGPGRH